ncbi:MAG: hypothetical protein IT518_26350 [Burkholderiales bacterium]|nr:hypothetical protein [Burkholderiales bacterium]
MVTPRSLAGMLAPAILVSTAALAAPVQPIVVQGLECRADDGAWRLDATRATAQYTATVPRKREVVFRGSLQALSAPTAIVWRGDSTHLPKDTLVLIARDEACRKPAPGGHRALLSIRAGEASTACCLVRAGFDARVAPVWSAAGKAGDDWTRALPDLLPAINACARDPKVIAVASAAASGGTARVRMVQAAGNAVECTVDASGRGTPTLLPSSAPASGNPLFFPPREPPPIVACGRLERVLPPRGALAGYLHYDPC